MRKTTIVSIALASMVFLFPMLALAEHGEISAAQAGGSVDKINKASSEDTVAANLAGTLIEIGNTTSANTTVIIRVANSSGGTDDVTVEVTPKTKLVTNGGKNLKLDEWIAGDPLVVKGIKNNNSGEIVASQITNKAMNQHHRAINGWIKEIRKSENEVDVSWANKVYTLNLKDAKIVAGLKNPATIEDLQAGDRIRARVTDDQDGNNLTWDASILVVLRRGETLFMRVTRWVVPAEIVELPDDCSVLPATLTVKILTNRFFEKGDVNNLIGEPGDTLEVTVSDTTQFRRRYFGNSLLCEFAEGDHVNILGRLNEETGQLDATIIKNNSIQMLGVATKVGIVDSIDEANKKLEIHLSEAGSATYTITANDSTEYYERTASSTLEAAEFSDIQTGDRVRVRGVLNRNSKNIAAEVILILPPLAEESSS